MLQAIADPFGPPPCETRELGLPGGSKRESMRPRLHAGVISLRIGSPSKGKTGGVRSANARRRGGGSTVPSGYHLDQAGLLRALKGRRPSAQGRALGCEREFLFFSLPFPRASVSSDHCPRLGVHCAACAAPTLVRIVNHGSPRGANGFLVASASTSRHRTRRLLEYRYARRHPDSRANTTARPGRGRLPRSHACRAHRAGLAVDDGRLGLSGRAAC